MSQPSDAPSQVTPETFKAQLASLTSQLAGRPLDAALDVWLNTHHGAGSRTYLDLEAACQAGAAAGWLCDREGGGIRYGRIFKPTPDLHGFSVDVVDMRDIAGPQHSHPLGEIDLVMPLEGEARFDGRPAARTGPPSARDVRWCSTFCPKGRSSSRADIHSPRECAGDMR